MRLIIWLHIWIWWGTVLVWVPFAANYDMHGSHRKILESPSLKCNGAGFSRPSTLWIMDTTQPGKWLTRLPSAKSHPPLRSSAHMGLCPSNSSFARDTALVWFSGECMVLVIAINNGIKRPTSGYRDFNTCHDLIVDGQLVSRWWSFVTKWSNTILKHIHTWVLLPRCMKVLAWSLDPNGIKYKIPLQTHTILVSRNAKFSF